VLASMACHWSNNANRKVTVVTLAPHSADFFQLPDGVGRVSVGSAGPPRRCYARLRQNVIALARLRSALASLRPDVVISFVDVMNVKVLLASVFTRWPVIVSERIDPSAHMVPWPWAWLRRVCYRQAAMIVVQTGAAAEWVRRRFPRSAVRVIPNPVVLGPTPVADDVEGRPHLPRPAIVAIGRLVPQKGFDVLIRAFSSACTTSPLDGRRWQLFIFGDGPERASLEALAQSLGVQERVHLPGRTRQTVAVLRAADLFVLASRYEGFPNVLLEAMANGLPSLSTACPSGPTDIIRDGVDGVLVPPNDTESMARAMKRLMSDDAERRRLAAVAPGILRRYNLEDVMACWDRAIEATLSGEFNEPRPLQY
jgi:GalNAc-alpha-(1->4)-GalNAc-alpha-(1->3)-diNAcBac-PP-undecaprenol alpha-1,4-N-acetyl-D-galactosaminyltransferase